MVNIFKYLAFICLSFILVGCVGTREPSVAQYNTGIKKTEEWTKYNEYAKKENLPILDFAATTLAYNKKGVKNYDNFLITDNRVVIQSKWHNYKSTDEIEFRFFMPDGRLYSYSYFKPSKTIDKWTIGRDLYIKGLGFNRMQGKWRVEIKVNGKKALSKSFLIGTDKEYETVKTNKTIGFAAYWDSKDTTWKHSHSLPQYTSNEALFDNKNIAIIPPKLFLKDLGNPQLSYETFENQVKEDLKDKDGVIFSFVKKHPMDYMILGTVKTSWLNGYSNTKVHTYIVDIKEKKIIKNINTDYASFTSNYISGVNKRVKSFHPDRIKAYKVVYKDLKDSIREISKR